MNHYCESDSAVGTQWLFQRLDDRKILVQFSAEVQILFSATMFRLTVWPTQTSCQRGIGDLFRDWEISGRARWLLTESNAKG